MNQYQSAAQNNSTSTETVTQTSFLITPKPETTIGGNGLMEIFLMGMVTLAGWQILYRRSSLYLDRAKPFKQNMFKKLAPTDCTKCRFYNHHSELQCDVHPVQVILSEAENCPDYWERDQLKFLHH